MSPPQITAREFEEWLNGAFIGDPKDAREYCTRTMSPNYLRFSAGGGRTDFERAVEKVTLFRTICRKWEAPVKFIVQEGNKIAVRCTVSMIIGDSPEQNMELMFKAERDDEGRFENVWELSKPIDKTAD
ncbi:unnamed protein product [Clonostachys rosea f. rosea IK726]|uniref:Uncharacterized protein n=2 Tax=Clonostachys rosea f. rosea IK726 TaxID=1349383 RepID=A0ACA9UQD2_BIOOC|nr:unnamed protein product [Clonostachys rosea f. rosea IK726]CAG9955416.1 unnamed protein product [Clonostachys rosea f. rosea IK726]